MTLEGKRIVVGVSGGIAAFKAVELVRELGRRGAEVRVVMTASATRFVGPLTFTGLTGKPAVTDLWDPSYTGEVHVELGEWADAVVVAPATANVLARAAAGLADDVLLATLSCARGPVLYAPAMHERMWRSPPTVRAVARLGEDGAHFAGPVRGMLASGQQGWGRMQEPGAIADAVSGLFGAGDLRERTVLISVGPTVEDLDPVRFLSNRSSERMGFAVAAAALARGARVVLVAGPTTVEPPAGCEVVPVRSALSMKAALEERLADADALVMTAAVADYRPAAHSEHKIKKAESDALSIALVKNPDILAAIGAARKGKRPVLVGFAMETDDVVGYGKKKLLDKQVDLIVANEASVGFGRDDTQVTLIDHDGAKTLAPSTKREVAERILDRVRELLA